MFQRLYTKLLLATLPSVETILAKVSTLLVRLDDITDTIEHHLENEAVRLAKLARDRRIAADAVQDAYDRKDAAALASISSARAKLDTASDARDRVAAALGL